jgi:hypothetical protein
VIDGARKVLLAIALLWGMGAVAATGAVADTAGEGTDEPAEVVNVRWRLVSVDGRQSLTLFASTGFCVGEEKPRLLRPRVVWRPGRAVITARMYFPARHHEPGELCADVGLGIRRQFRFAHLLVGRALYDGSTSPPRLQKLPPTPRER